MILLRVFVKLREEDFSWFLDLDKWFFIKLVCICLLVIVIERDSIFLGVGLLISEKLVGGFVGFFLEEDRVFF